MRPRIPVWRSLRGAIVSAALVAVAIAVLVGSIVAGIATARSQHATLDAASSAVRYAVANADAAHLRAELGALRASLATWGVAAAAFDRSGAFVAGDDRMRSDGLPAGRASAPLAARQMALIPTRDGYVLLTVDPDVIWRLRASVIGGALAIVLCVLLVAYFGGARWSRTFAEQLERTSEQREERLRAFLAEAAHELRTPLAIAVGYLGILERGGLEDAALAKRIVRDVAAEQTRLQQLVERILHLARLDAVPAAAGAVADVAIVVDEAIALVRPLDTALDVRVTIPSGSAAAIAPDELRDAVRNVLENAIRYAPAAAVTATVTAEPSALVLTVADSGPGMDSVAAAHAFDRFYRGPDRGDVPGTGLGLAIVRRIAERAGGSAVLTSAPGAGTSITLRLPRAV